MSKELLKQLKVGDKVWVRLEVSQTIDDEGDVTFKSRYSFGEDKVYINDTNNFSLSNPNELTVRELCEWIAVEDKHNDGLTLYSDGRGVLNYIHRFLNTEEATNVVRHNTQRKEEIKKQIEELQNELNNL